MKRIWKVLGIGALSATVTAGVAAIVGKVRAVRQFDSENFFGVETPDVGHEAHHMPGKKVVDKGFCPYDVKGCLTPENFDRPLDSCPCAGTDSCLRKHTVIDSYDGGYFRNLLEAFGGGTPEPTSYAEQLGLSEDDVHFGESGPGDEEFCGSEVDFGESCGEGDDPFEGADFGETDKDSLGDEDEEFEDGGVELYDQEDEDDEDESGVEFCDDGDEEEEYPLGSEASDEDSHSGQEEHEASIFDDPPLADGIPSGFVGGGIITGAWTKEDETLLSRMVSDGYSVESCASHFHRSKNAIKNKAKKLKLEFWAEPVK